jgi:hypothetical protein
VIPDRRTAVRLDVGRELARRRAGVLLIITLLLWLYQWLPALSVAAFLVWIVLHNRLEGDLGARVVRGWRRIWPPAVMVVVPLLVVGILTSWMSGLPIDRTILPIGLNLLGLSMIVWGEWRRPFGRAPDQT